MVLDSRSVPRLPLEMADNRLLEIGDSLWDQIWTKVNSILKGGEKLQLVYPTVSWYWSPPNPGYINSEAYSIVNQMPQWSAVVGMHFPSATDLFTAYKIMLSSCPKLTMPPDLEKQLQEIQVQINEATRKLQADEKAKNIAWIQSQNVPPRTKPPIYDEWMQTSGWRKRLDDDLQAIEKANDIKVQLIKQQNEGYEAAINACALPTGPKAGFAKCNINGIEEWRANYVVSDVDWASQLVSGKRGIPLSIHIDSTNRSSSINMSWAQGARDHPGFLCTEDGGKLSNLFTIGDVDFVINIDIKAITVVPIQQDSWYSSHYIAQLAEKGWWNSPFTTKGGNSPVFGKGGLLSLKISGLIAGVGISFRMKYTPKSSMINTLLTGALSNTVVTQLYDVVPRRIVTSQKFHIGPFRFDTKRIDTLPAIAGIAPAIGGTTPARMNAVSVFSGESSDTHPEIIGFIVSEFSS